MVNTASPLDPHSSTGYLQAIEVRPGQRRGRVYVRAARHHHHHRHAAAHRARRRRRATPPGADPARFVGVARAGGDRRRPQAGDRGDRPAAAKTGDDLALARIDPTRRFVAADLTRDEIETLRSRVAEVGIARLYNATKRALIHESIDTVRARAAQGAHGADGHGIVWAVLDTGINGDHPHFRRHGNVARQFDCTELGKVSAHRGSARLDRSGHGTHVAGITPAKIPEELDLMPMGVGAIRRHGAAAALWGKVLRDDGSGQDFIIKALDHIAETNDNAGRLVVHGVNLESRWSVRPERLRLRPHAAVPSCAGCGSRVWWW